MVNIVFYFLKIVEFFTYNIDRLVFKKEDLGDFVDPQILNAEPADIIQYDCIGIYHYALYVGEGEILHLLNDGKIHHDQINYDPQKNRLCRVNNKLNSAKAWGLRECQIPEEVMGQAWQDFQRSDVGYKLLGNNCEHQVMYWKYGISFSLQASSHRFFYLALLCNIFLFGHLIAFSTQLSYYTLPKSALITTDFITAGIVFYIFFISLRHLSIYNILKEYSFLDPNENNFYIISSLASFVAFIVMVYHIYWCICRDSTVVASEGVIIYNLALIVNIILINWD